MWSLIAAHTYDRSVEILENTVIAARLENH
jgi:hypothetical protein